MIFATYEGVKNDDSLTPGNVYIAQLLSKLENGVSVTSLELLDNSQNIVNISPRKGDGLFDFKFINECYAVVLFESSFLNAPCGSILTIIGIEFFDILQGDSLHDKIMFNIKGLGWYHREQLMEFIMLLDINKIFPGFNILDKNGKWVKISSVNDCLWVNVGRGGFEDLSNFTLAVDLDGDVISEPYVKCVNKSEGITCGNWYRLIYNTLSDLDTSGNDLVCIVNDNGQQTHYFKSSFVF